MLPKKLKRSVRQGVPIPLPPPNYSHPPPTPQLFTAAIQEVFKDAQLEENEINIDGEKLSDLRFADGVALTREDVRDMEHQLNTVNKES